MHVEGGCVQISVIASKISHVERHRVRKSNHVHYRTILDEERTDRKSNPRNKHPSPVDLTRNSRESSEKEKGL